MARFDGRFYFKLTSNGNLLGEFSNNGMTTVATESCDLVVPLNGFEGDYHSTWQENRKPCFADLIIRLKSPQNPKLFKLEWKGSANFEGNGMLCDDILIGDYHSK